MKDTKYNEFKSLVKDITKGYKWKLLWTLLLFTIKNSPTWVLPILIAKLIDLYRITPETRLFLLFLYGGVMLLLVLQNYYTHVFYIKSRSNIERSIGMELRIKICRQLQQLSILYHKRTSIGRLHSKIIRDIEAIENFPRILVEVFYSTVINILLALIVILLRAPLAVIFFVVLVVIAVILRRKFHSVFKEKTKLLRTSMENMSASLSDMMLMMPVTRAHGLEETELQNVREKIKDVSSKRMIFDTVGSKFGALGWVSLMTCHVIFLMLAVYFSFKGLVTLGDVFMFNAFFASTANSITALLNTLPEITRIRESTASIIEVLNRPDIERNEGKKKFEKFDGNFDFQNVSYHYPVSNSIALNNISFKVNAGQSIAVIGPSGCGKTTLLFLILGFIRPTGGRILLDGQDMNELDLRTVRNYVGVVSQEIVFFSGTIKENIAYGEQKVSDEKVIEALNRANAWEFVKELPKGIHTYFGEDGTDFSGGQKQRFAIARALIRLPKVLILDEATSQLDIESEKLIQSTLEHIMKNQTTFIVSHRLSIVRNADIIVIMERGKIITMGSYDGIAKLDNKYSRFFKNENVAV